MGEATHSKSNLLKINASFYMSSSNNFTSIKIEPTNKSITFRTHEPNIKKRVNISIVINLMVDLSDIPILETGIYFYAV